MIISNSHQYHSLIEIRTRSYHPTFPEIPTVKYDKIIEFNTETKEALCYATLPTINTYPDGKVDKLNTTVLYSPTGKIKLTDNDFEIATFKCHLPYAKAYWKNTDTELLTEDQLNFPPKISRS